MKAVIGGDLTGDYCAQQERPGRYAPRRPLGSLLRGPVISGPLGSFPVGGKPRLIDSKSRAMVLLKREKARG